MKASKKVINKIKLISFLTEVIDNNCNDKRIGDHNVNTEKSFIHSPPEEWNEDEKLLFNVLTEMEYKMKDEILKILGYEEEEK